MSIPVVEANEGDDLPEGWASTPLEHLVIFALGGEWGRSEADHDIEDDVPVRVVRGTEFRSWRQSRASGAARRFIARRSLEKRGLRPGDLVLEVSGGGPGQPVGRTLVIDHEALESSDEALVCSNFCRQVRLAPDILPVFAQLFLAWEHRLGHLNRFQTETTNIRNLNVTDFLGQTTIPVPPLMEQQRIVVAVEGLLARVEAGRARLDRMPAILKRFRQAVLAAACSGRLTEDWRDQRRTNQGGQKLLQQILEDRRRFLDSSSTSVRRTKYRDPDLTIPEDLPELPDSWVWAPVDAISTRVVDGVHQKPDYVEAGIPFVTVRNLTAGRQLTLESTRFIREEDHLQYIARANPERGDLLVSKDGTLGVIRAVRTDEPFSIFVSVAMIKPVSTELTDFLELALSSPQVQDQMVGTGSGLQHIHLRDLRRDCVPLPPLEEQQEIVRRVEGLFALADAVERRVAAARKQADLLPQAILARAFSGKLVPTEAELARREGRAYEPASALLERIRRERASEPSVRRGRGGGRRSGAR